MQVEIRNGTAPTPNTSPSPTPSQIDPNDVPEVVLETTPLEKIREYQAAVEKGMRQAELDGNLSALASLAQKAAALIAVQIKATPIPKADPNDDPLMIKAKQQAKERFLRLVNAALEVK